MVKRIIWPVLSFILATGCTGSNNKSMPAESPARQTSAGSNGYASVNGIKMYYEIHGEGAPLVLIHGGGSTIQTSFGNILPLLETQHKVIAVELQAHGHTSDRDSPETFEQDANDVVALLAYLKIEKADFMGFSNGGHTSMEIAIRHPQVVNKLILVSVFYKKEGTVKGFFEGLEKATLENMPAPLKEAFLKINNDTGLLQRMFDKDRARMLQFKDWSDHDVASIKAPTLLIAGDADVVTTEHAVQMSQIIQNSQLMILPGTHGSFIGEVCTAKPNSKMPGLVVAAIEEFLSK